MNLIPALNIYLWVLLCIACTFGLVALCSLLTLLIKGIYWKYREFNDLWKLDWARQHNIRKAAFEQMMLEDEQ